MVCILRIWCCSLNIEAPRLIEAQWRHLTNRHWFRQRFLALTAPNCYMNHCWNIVDWTLRSKLQWNLSRNSHISIQENAFEHVWKMAALLSRRQYVKGSKKQSLPTTQQPQYNAINHPSVVILPVVTYSDKNTWVVTMYVINFRSL